jgi:hypothetical protein
LKYLDTKPLVLIQDCAYLNNIWTHSLNFSPKLNLLNTWSTHPHSTQSKAFCWSKNIMIPSSSSRSVYSIISCIRRFASKFQNFILQINKMKFQKSTLIFVHVCFGCLNSFDSDPICVQNKPLVYFCYFCSNMQIWK